MNKENIILIGMPGSGKSTCGVLAAKALLKNFFDTDLLLQGLEERALQETINTDGTDYFLFKFLGHIRSRLIPLIILCSSSSVSTRTSCCL